MRHHGRAGSKGIVQLHKAKLSAAPQANFLAQTAHVHHEGGSKGQKFDNIIAVAYCIHGIGINSAKVQLFGHHMAINGEGGAGNSTSAQGHHIRTRPNAQETALQHIEICQQVMSKGNRLRTLQMGIARHQGLLVLLRYAQQRFLKAQQKLSNLRYLALHIHMHIQCYLVVAAARSVQARTGAADALG